MLFKENIYYGPDTGDGGRAGLKSKVARNFDIDPFSGQIFEVPVIPDKRPVPIHKEIGINPLDVDPTTGLIYAGAYWHEHAI